MAVHHLAKRYVLQSKEKILEMHEQAYTLKEIFAEIPELNQNISYQSLSRVCLQMDLFNKKKSKEITSKEEVETQEITSNPEPKKEMTNAERNLEKLTNRKPKFSYDPHTKGKDFY